MNKLAKSGTLFPSVFTDFFDTDRFFGNPWVEKEYSHTLPAVNIKEGKANFDIEFAAPGFDKKDFTIHVEGNILTISAEKTNEHNEEDKQFTRKEFSYTSFNRSFTLPETANHDKIDAAYNNGILKLTVPKKDTARIQTKKEINIA